MTNLFNVSVNLFFYVLKKNKLYSFKKNNKKMERKQKENVSIIVYKVAHPFTYFVVKIQIKNFQFVHNLLSKTYFFIYVSTTRQWQNMNQYTFCESHE